MEYIPRRHKGREMKMGCVWGGMSDMSRVVGKGESVLLRKPPNLRARMKCTQWLPKWEGKETRCLI